MFHLVLKLANPNPGVAKCLMDFFKQVKLFPGRLAHSTAPNNGKGAFFSFFFSIDIRELRLLFDLELRHGDIEPNK